MKRFAFTLLEMLVVLTTLAVLTTVAVQSLEPVGRQARVEATQRTLNNLRDAVVGKPASATDAFSTTVCFAADMGRLPTTVDELLAPGALPAFGLATDGDDAAVQLSRGWRGPYLQLPAGATVPLDGWNRPLVGTSDATGLSVASLGADGLPGGTTPYAADLQTQIRAGGTLDSYQGAEICGNVFQFDGMAWSAPSEAVTVKLYSVDVAQNDGIRADTQQLDVGTNHYRFALPTIGPKVLVAETATKKCRVDLMVRPGTTLTVDLRLQDTSTSGAPADPEN
ncbi:MAG: type II secretion system protein GspG [Planctomycetaceae bacterium]|nr:type II secretion system protein GspG [Planctomycetaceae bacterium]